MWKMARKHTPQALPRCQNLPNQQQLTESLNSTTLQSEQIERSK